MPAPNPLTDTELDRLDDFLHNNNPGEAMSLEEMDGFSYALICGPELVPPSDYLPLVFGSEAVEGRGFKTIEEAQHIMTLLTRHWNIIAATLFRDDPYPLLIEQAEDGDFAGEEWAKGFELGMSLRDDGWNKLIEDDEFAVLLVPIVALVEASNPDSGFTEMTPEVRAEAIDALAVGVLMLYRYFRDVIPDGNVREGRKKPKRPSKKRRVQ